MQSSVSATQHSRLRQNREDRTASGDLTNNKTERNNLFLLTTTQQSLYICAVTTAAGWHTAPNHA